MYGSRLGQVRLGGWERGSGGETPSQRMSLGQVRLGQVRLGQVRLGQVRLGQVRLGQVRLGQVRLGQVRYLRSLFFEQTTKCIFERTVKRIFLSLYIVQFVCSINVLSKFNFFERTLIRKNVRKQRFSNERNSKEKNEFRKNVIRTNDLVPLNKVEC